MKNIIDNSYKKPDQYQLKRALIKQYGAQKQDLNTWVANHYRFEGSEKILELGCGTGEFWQTAASLLKPNNHLLLSDYSDEMLIKTKATLEKLSIPCPIDFQQHSVDDLHLPNNYFDIMLAHLMIYHSSDLVKSLDDITCALKPTGWFGATTQGTDSFKSHMQVAHQIDSTMPDYCINSPAETEKLAVLLQQRFNQVQQFNYINRITWPSGKVATDFSRLLLSIMVHQPDEHFFKAYEQAVDNMISKQGSFTTSIHMSLFICTHKL